MFSLLLFNSHAPTTSPLLSFAQRGGAIDSAATYDTVELQFTFVRDPLARFVSGYSEIMYRSEDLRGPPPLPDNHYDNYHEHVPPYTFVDYDYASQDRARAFINDLLSGVNSDTDKHVYPQVGALRRVKKDSSYFPPLGFVGALESFGNDWDTLSELGGFSYLPYDYSMGMHPTSTSTARDAMSALLAHDMRYLRALCFLLAPDFACLGYALPQNCTDLTLQHHDLSIRTLPCSRVLDLNTVFRAGAVFASEAMEVALRVPVHL